MGSTGRDGGGGEGQGDPKLGEQSDISMFLEASMLWGMCDMDGTDVWRLGYSVAVLQLPWVLPATGEHTGNSRASVS